jgi:hypothetical protein
MILSTSRDAELLDFGGAASFGKGCRIESLTDVSRQGVGESNARGRGAAEAGTDREIII